MSITTTTQTALAAIAAAHPDLAVTVAYRGTSGTGVQVMTDARTEPGERGQGGTTYGTVRVSAATFAEDFARGAHVTIDGVQVYVEDCRTTAGIRVVEYCTTQPVEGV